MTISVPKLDAIDVAFPTNPPLPSWDSIPEQFKRQSNPHAQVAGMLFFRGGKLDEYGLKVKPGLDAKDVMNALRACLGSFSPKHEHKEAGVAYLLSEWCEGTPSIRKSEAA